MKNSIRNIWFFIIASLFILELQFVYGEEVYVPVTLATIKWGSAENDFGIPDIPRGRELGPQYLTVTSMNEIFILDAVKKQLLIFDTEGKYKRTIKLEIDYELGTIETKVDICVDSRDNIYIYPQTWGFFVDKFNKDGNLIKRFLIKTPYSKMMEDAYLKFKKEDVTYSLIPEVGEDVVYQGFYIFNDASGRVFLSANYKDNRELRIGISNKDTKHEFKRGLRGKALNGLEGFEAKKVKDDSYEIQKIDKNGSITKKIKIALPGKYIEGKQHFFAYSSGEDYEGNIYVQMSERKFDEKTQKWDLKVWTNKYDKEGNLRAQINLTEDLAGVIRDNKGDYYQIKWDLRKLDEGVQLIKWSCK
jgi:hypothetical protein